MLTKKEWLTALTAREGQSRLAAFQKGRVAICGLGGLGSRVAELLTRAGVGYLRLVDFDRIEATNLNRQLFFMDQLGKYKADALGETLLRITPYVTLDIRKEKITPHTLPVLLGGVDVIVEALDLPGEKAMLTNGVREQFPDCAFVAASGMAGLGSGNALKIRKISRNFYLCGDGTNGVEEQDGLYGARVTLCAAQEALTVLQILCEETVRIVERGEE